VAGSSINQEGGGGIYNTGALTVSSSTFSSNYGWFGGGIYSVAKNSTSKLVLIGCSFTGNGGNEGCGLDNQSGSASIIDCTFTGNGSYIAAGYSTDDGDLQQWRHVSLQLVHFRQRRRQLRRPR
jgi:hypothetical protein